MVQHVAGWYHTIYLLVALLSRFTFHACRYAAVLSVSRLLSSIQRFTTDRIMHTIDTWYFFYTIATAIPALVSANSPKVPGVGKKADKDMSKMEKDMPTPPPPLKETLGDIYGGGSTEEVDNGAEPLPATQGRYY